MKFVLFLTVLMLSALGLMTLVSAQESTEDYRTPRVQSNGSLPFTDEFGLYEVDLTSTGRNPFFILEPGYRQVYANDDTMLTITVTNNTKVIKGVSTRIVREVQTEAGQVVEISLNYFAISKKNRSVFYFGEDTDIFDSSGRVVSHEGSWRAGRNGAREGLIMPGIVLVGARYMQENAPGVALDRAEIVSVDETLTVPVGTFHDVIKEKDTTTLEPGVVEFKWYAAGIGLIRDADLELVAYGFVR